MRKIVILVMVLVISLAAVLSCSPVSQEQYDEVNQELEEARARITSLQSDLDEAGNLAAQNEQLREQSASLADQLDAIKAVREELSAQNEAVMEELAAAQDRWEQLSPECRESGGAPVIIETPPIIEEDVEQAIFDLINQDRQENGLNELTWGINVYKVAQTNNVNMERDQRLLYPQHGSYQEAARVAGYTDTDTMAEAVFKIWRNTFTYDLEFLKAVTNYGAVAVYQSEGIYYISFIADINR